MVTKRDTEKKRIKPGNLVLDYSHNFYNFPLWGFVLPPEKFVEKFEDAKGERWPTGSVLDNKNYEEFTDKWGSYMPLDKRITHIPFDEGETHTILSPEEFANSNDSIGVWYLGNVWSSHKEKYIDFEVRDSSSHFPFEIKDLDTIIRTRKATFLEAGSESRVLTSDAGFDLKTIHKYFKGEFSGKVLDKIGYSEGARATEIVELLRGCDFPENMI